MKAKAKQCNISSLDLTEVHAEEGAASVPEDSQDADATPREDQEAQTVALEGSLGFGQAVFAFVGVTASAYACMLLH